MPSPVFNIGDRIIVTKQPSELLRLPKVGRLEGKQGSVVRIRQIGGYLQYGVDLGIRTPVTHVLQFWKNGEEVSGKLPTPTGYWFFKTYLKLAGPPDNDGDWI